jgi:hypothetical protein
MGVFLNKYFSFIVFIFSYLVIKLNNMLNKLFFLVFYYFFLLSNLIVCLCYFMGLLKENS